MKPRVWIASLMFAGIVAGCGTLPGEAAAPTPAASPTPTITPAPTATRTPRPAQVAAAAGKQPVNCRFGPGIIYQVISSLDEFQTTRADGRDLNGRWLYVHDPLNPGGFCWVSVSAVDVKGEADSLPVLDPPRVSVIKVDVHVEPERVTVNCNNFPQFVLFVADVTTNGPGVVNWRWEISSGEVTEPQIMTFEEAGTQTLTKSFVIPSPNDYWVRLHVNAPNDISDETNFVANCTP